MLILSLLHINNANFQYFVCLYYFLERKCILKKIAASQTNRPLNKKKLGPKRFIRWQIFYCFGQGILNLVRKVVAGPKNTTTFEGRELDLTYITQRVIAMAFPASQLFEKTYRNRIEDVVAYFNQKHPNNYLIINVSSRIYDYALFDKRVKDYQWPDHQSPPLTTLISIGYEIYKFLKGMAKQDSQKRVVAVHCNHGKGRTGTTIISFLLLIRSFQSAVDCLKFYNSKRFNKETYGVDQPCQLRYLQYIEKLMKSPKIDPKLICYRLKRISQKGLNCEYYVKIQFTRNESILFQKVDFGFNIEEPIILLSDILIEIYSISWNGSKKIARINANLYFVDQSLQLTFNGKDLKLCDSNHHSDFSITLHLQYYCLCHLPMYGQTVCKCKYQRTIQQKYWQQMIKMVKQFKKVTAQQAENILNLRKIKVKSTFKAIKISSSKSRSKDKERERERQKNVLVRSISSRKIKSSHKEKLAERVYQRSLQNAIIHSNFSPPLIKSQKIRKLSDQVQYYSDDFPIIKISKVQKIQ